MYSGNNRKYTENGILWEKWLLPCRCQERYKSELGLYDCTQRKEEERLPGEVLYKEEDGDGDLHIRGKDILSPLWKIEFWKMEAGRTDHCGK
jgi:hypothetical protein